MVFPVEWNHLEVSYGTLKGIESGQTEEEMELILEERLLEVRHREIERGINLNWSTS